MRLFAISTMIFIAISTVGCGQKGPLVMPQSPPAVDSDKSSNQR